MNADYRHTSADHAGAFCQQIGEQIQEYATAVVLGSDQEPRYAPIAEHMHTCRACQAELYELLALLQPALDGTVTPSAEYPAADLGFLKQTKPASRATPAVWHVENGWLVIQFSSAMLSENRYNLAGGARTSGGQLLYRYKQDPGSVHDLDVSIEVYAEDTALQHARVRVGVDVASRDPLDQSGSLVTLHLGALDWHGKTDEAGCIDFAPISLDDLQHLRVEIAPPAS